MPGPLLTTLGLLGALAAAPVGPAPQPGQGPPAEADDDPPPSAEPEHQTPPPESTTPGVSEPTLDPPPSEPSPDPSEATPVEPEPSPDPSEATPVEPEPSPDPSEATPDEPEPDDEEDWFGDDADTEPFPESVDDDEAGGSGEGFDDYDPIRDSPQALAARHWIRAGIVLTATGGVLGIGSILMAASDPDNLKIGNSGQVDARNRAALTMGIPAVVLVAGGATALVIGLRRRSQLRVAPMAGRSGGGVVLRGRF